MVRPTNLQVEPLSLFGHTMFLYKLSLSERSLEAQIEASRLRLKPGGSD
jgi:hypothetical protein